MSGSRSSLSFTVFVLGLVIAVRAFAADPEFSIAVPQTPILGTSDWYASLPPPPPDGLSHAAAASYYEDKAKEYSAQAQSSRLMADAAQTPGAVIYGERYVVGLYRIEARGFDEAADRSRTLASLHHELARQAALARGGAPYREEARTAG